MALFGVAVTTVVAVVVEAIAQSRYEGSYSRADDVISDLGASGSAAGITLEHGLTTSRAALADTLNAAAESAHKKVGLLDSTKFKRDSLTVIGERVRDALTRLPEPVAPWSP